MISLFGLLFSFVGIDGAKNLAGPNLEITQAEVTLHQDLELMVFAMEVKGKAGHTVPKAAGALHGAPVLGYVFPTSLKPEHVGFVAKEGIVALAVTSHPDFDDTPLWDENNDRDYANDGVEWHPHWVLLGKDDRVPGGLSVIQIKKDQISKVLPPTNPGMPMYMDSPGFSVVTRGSSLKVLVPLQRLDHQKSFSYDGVAAYMQVNTSGEGPMLGVYQVYSVASGDLSLPYKVKSKP